MNEPTRSGTAGTYRLIGLGILAAAVIAAVGIYLFASGGGEQEPRIIGLIDDTPPGVGQPAPDFALPDVRDEGSVLRLSSFEGKVVVLNWYASWCAPCRQEIPDFQVAWQYLNEDVVFFGVNLEEGRETALGILTELGATYPAVVDNEGTVSQHYRVTGMPVTYIIDREGIIVAGGRGLMTEQTLRDQLAQFGLTYPEDS